MGTGCASTARRLVALGATAAAGLTLTLAVASPAASSPAGASPGADGSILGTDHPDAIAGSYLVVYRDGLTTQAEELTASLAAQYDVTVTHTYSRALRGFAGRLTEQAARKLAADPNVAFVEQDATVTAAATQSPTPSWALDRIDQRDLPLNNSYTYPDSAGLGVRAYVIDTGIRTTHTDFGGRAVWGTNTTGDGNDTDCNGHGTHVAGVLGSATYGVAKRATLVAVKVLNCQGSGSFAGVVAGIDWVTANHTPSSPAVANMSLGASGSNTALETAIRTSIADGVVYAVAAGGGNSDACNFTPARVAEAITVASSTDTDARASFSNSGPCVDIFAPGMNMPSTWHTSDSATNTISGTSTSSPQAAGAAALILGTFPSFTPNQTWLTLRQYATLDRLTGLLPGTPNRLLYVAPYWNFCGALTNGTDFPIPDLGTAQSSIYYPCPNRGSQTATVEVHIIHTWIGDLVVDLIAPDGTAYNLHNRSGGSADNLHATYTLDLSARNVTGTWLLRVRDQAGADIGYLDSWTLNPAGW